MCILVVEDEALVLLDLAEGLRAEGFEVMTASNAPEATEILAQMPHGMTGGDLILQVRAAYPDIPIMLATATLLDLTPEWLDEHRVTLMPKPFEADVLAAQLRHEITSLRPR